MRAIQGFTISRPISTAMFFLGIVLVGSIALSRLETNLLPRIEFPRLSVITLFPNASPQEVENLITRPVAETIGTVGGIRRITSSSTEGQSLVVLEFGWDSNVDFAAMKVRERVDLVRSVLPEDASKSLVSRFDPSQEPIVEIVFFTTGLARKRDLRRFVEKEIKVYLDRIDGVALVQLSGGDLREIELNVDPRRLQAYELSLTELGDSLRSSNLNSPAGQITLGSKDVLIRTLGEFSNVAEIGRTVIGRTPSGSPIELSDVTEIKDGYRERTGSARYNGLECVVVSIYREAGRNTVEVAGRVRTGLVDIHKRFGKDVEGRIVFDQSRFISQSISNIGQSLLIGASLAFVALFLILRNLRSPLVLVSVIPVSLLATALAMYLFGISLNMMSLGGLAVGIGMLFDSGNVVLSAIERHRRAGLLPKEAALHGASEVSGSITAAVLTTIIVFLPIIFLEGIAGVIFREMAMTIAFSLAVSLVVSLTLIPMLASLGRPLQATTNAFSLLARAEALEGRLESAYERRLQQFLRKPGRVLSGLVVLFLLAILSASFLPREFTPKVDTGEFTVDIRNVRGSPLESTTDVVRGIEKLLQHDKEVEHVVSIIGYDKDQLLSRNNDDKGTHRASMRVVLSDSRRRTSGQVAGALRAAIHVHSGIQVRVHESGDILSRIMSPDARAIQLEITGDDLSTLSEIGARIEQDIAKLKGLVGVESSMSETGREFRVEMDEARLAAFELNRAEVARFLRDAIAGSVPTVLRVGDDEVDIRVRYREQDRRTLAHVHAFRLKTPRGGTVYLSEVARTTESKGYTSILRQGSIRVNRVSADVRGVSLNRAFSDVERYVARLKLPEGYHVRFAGEKEEIEDSFRELGFALALAVLLIYMLLAAQLESLSRPLLLMGTIPLIAIGIVPALAITGKTINVISLTGIIMLIGIVVDNAVLYHEYVEVLLREGHQVRTAVIESGKIVLRPVLMNNGTTLLGLLPVALQLGQGTEFQSPMAIVVISGLFASAFLSLFLVPLLIYRAMRKTHGAHS